MGTTRSVVKKAESPEWLRCQHAIRKLMLGTGKDSLVYAKGALEHEDSEPERLKTFWDNARRYFDEYEMPTKTAPKPKAPAAVPPPPPPAAPEVREEQVPETLPAVEKGE